MNRLSAGNQIEEIYKRTGSIIDTAKELNLKYKQVHSYLYNNTDYVSIRKKPVKTTSYNKDYFKVIDSPDKAYFLGLIKADGYIDRTRNRLALRLQEKDVELLNKLCDCVGFPLNRINTIDMSRRGTQNHVEFAVSNAQFVTPILDAKYPSILEKVPEEFSYDFIRGYFDGDGSIAYKNLRKLYFSVSVVGSPDDDHMLKYIMERIQGFTKIYIDKRSNLPFLKTDNQAVIRNFRDLVYKDATLYLSRKKFKFDHFSLLFDTSTSRRKTSQADEDVL